MNILFSLFRFIRKELRKGNCFYCQKRRELRKIKNRTGIDRRVCFECYITTIANRNEKRRFFRMVEKNERIVGNGNEKRK